MGAPGIASPPRRRRQPPRPDPGPAAVAPEPASRLPLPPALPLRDEHLQDGGAAAHAGRGRPRPHPGLPPRPGDEGPRGGEAARRNDGGGLLVATAVEAPVD